MKIKRYDWYVTDGGSVEFTEETDGEWVPYEDHERKTTALRAYNKKLLEHNRYLIDYLVSSDEILEEFNRYMDSRKKETVQ